MKRPKILSLFSFQSTAVVGSTVLLAFMMAFSCSTHSSDSVNGGTTPKALDRLTLMHTNDMHSHFLGVPSADYDPTTTGDGTMGGIARIAAKVKEVRAARAVDGVPVLLLDGGDFAMGTLFHLLEGEAEMGIMNLLGYDNLTLGNHEFDWLATGAAAIVDQAAGLPVQAANLEVTDTSDPGGQALQDQIDAGEIYRYQVMTLANGIKAGFFGVLGENASDVVYRPDPDNYPLTFQAIATAAANTVDILKNQENVDIVICISHSGVDSADPTQGEDPDLAAAVPGIDVIVSGHTHTNMPQYVTVGNTFIVQAMAYTKRLGVLDLQRNSGTWSVLSYDYVTIDDTIVGDAATQTLVEQYVDKVDDEILEPNLGEDFKFRSQIAETAFDLIKVAGEEFNLGDLVTDANRWAVDQVQYDPGDPDSVPVAFSVESNGVIRDSILMGQSGRLNVSDAFRVLPLGYDPTVDASTATQYEKAGYPLLAFYLYGDEIRQACEVDATAYPILQDSDFWLSYSGLKFTYFSQGIPFARILEIQRCLDPVADDPECNRTALLRTDRANRKLWKVVANYYLALNIALLKDKSYGILDVVPKDKDGNRLEDLTEAIVYKNPGTPDQAPLKQWEGFFNYLASFPDTDGDGIPNIPERYRNIQNRLVDACFIATVTYGSPYEPKVQTLRDFRDNVLVKSAVGRKFVEYYYSVGKTLSVHVDQHAWLKTLVRFLLLPVIGIAKVMLWLV